MLLTCLVYRLNKGDSPMKYSFNEQGNRNYIGHLLLAVLGAAKLERIPDIKGRKTE